VGEWRYSSTVAGAYEKVSCAARVTCYDVVCCLTIVCLGRRETHDCGGQGLYMHIEVCVVPLWPDRRTVRTQLRSGAAHWNLCCAIRDCTTEHGYDASRSSLGQFVFGIIGFMDFPPVF
jgi:hypothetical protein